MHGDQFVARTGFLYCRRLGRCLVFGSAEPKGLCVRYLSSLVYSYQRPSVQPKRVWKKVAMNCKCGLAADTQSVAEPRAPVVTSGCHGWILTAPHGPGFLKGRFEYAVDAVPAFVVFQPANTAYGFGLNPLGLKWNFATRETVVPYVELGGGTLFTTHTVPAGTSSVNFTSSAAFGVHFLREKAWSVEVRYMHISSAGLSSPNPGLNTVQVRLGFGKFWGSK
jgi:hypothetical protein